MFKRLYMALVTLMLFANVSNAQSVGSHMAKKTDKKVIKTEIPRNKMLVGFNGGMGGTFGIIRSLDFTAGMDMAFSINKKFAIGYSLSYETLTKATFGLLFVHGDYSKGGCFLWGFGCYYDFGHFAKNVKFTDDTNVDISRKYDGNGLRLRLGFKASSQIYYGLNLSYGYLNILNIYDDEELSKQNGNTFGFNVTVGYLLK